MGRGRIFMTVSIIYDTGSMDTQFGMLSGNATFLISTLYLLWEVGADLNISLTSEQYGADLYNSAAICFWLHPNISTWPNREIVWCRVRTLTLNHRYCIYLNPDGNFLYKIKTDQKICKSCFVFSKIMSTQSSTNVHRVICIIFS